MAKASDQALESWLCTTANSAITPARYTGPRQLAVADRIAGRPTARYQGTIATSAIVAMILDRADSWPASMISRIATQTMA